MRIITIDNGNSNPHVGVFVDSQLTEVIPLTSYSPCNDDFIVASHVAQSLNVQVSYDLARHRPTKDHSFYFEMPVDYSEKIGDDRLIVAYGLFHKIKSSTDKILVIDAGTFMTMDLVTPKGFQGGFIFPGVQTFLKSYQRGAKLPLLDWDSPLHLTTLPQSTEQAILGALELYLSTVIADVIKKTSPNKIVLTGGSSEKIAHYFSKTNLEFHFDLNLHLIHLAMFSIIESHLHR